MTHVIHIGGWHSVFIGQLCHRWKEIVFLTFHLRRFPGSGSQFLLWTVASTRRFSPAPQAWRRQTWGNCVMCPGALLWLQENLYLKRPVAPTFPDLQVSTGYAVLGNAINSHYFSSQDKQTNRYIFKTRRPGNSDRRLPQLAFRFTRNHDNSIDACCQGT